MASERETFSWMDHHRVEVAKLEAERDALKEEVAAYDGDLTRTIDERDDYWRRLCAANTENDHLNASAEMWELSACDARAERDELKAERDALKAERNRLEAVVVRVTNDRDALKAELNELEIKLDAFKRGKELLDEQAVRLLKENAKLRELAGELWKYQRDWIDNFASLAEFEAFEAKAKALYVVGSCTCAFPYRTDGEVHDRRCPSWNADDEHKRDTRPGRERIRVPK